MGSQSQTRLSGWTELNWSLAALWCCVTLSSYPPFVVTEHGVEPLRCTHWFHTEHCVYGDPSLPIHPDTRHSPWCPCILSLCLFCIYSFCFAYRFICTIFSRLHVYVLIYDISFSPYDLFHSV